MIRSIPDIALSWRPLSAAVLLLLCANAPLPAQNDAAGFSARIVQAREAFDTGRFEEAAGLFDALNTDFGDNPRAASALAANRALHALSLVRSNAFPKALPMIDKALAAKETKPASRDLLTYFRGVSLLHMERWHEARTALLAYFNETNFDRNRRMEALLVAGGTFLKENKPKEAAAFFGNAAERLRDGDPALAARAGLLRLQALLRSNDPEAALAAVCEGYKLIEQQPQLITFQTMTLQLGQQFLDAEQWHKAIICFQRIWSRDRLLRHQREQLATWHRQHTVASASPTRSAEAWRLESLRTAVLPEVESLETNTDFDAAVRFRLAQSFLKLGRFREAAMVLETMLRELPAGELVENASLPLAQSWLQARRWEKVVEVADLYEKKFGPSTWTTHHPDVLFLKALAMENDARYLAAADVCADVVRRFPKSPLADEALFKQGFLLLMADSVDEGLKILGTLPGRFPKSPLIEDAFYWEGEALSLLEKYDEARTHLATYLDQVKNTGFRGDYLDLAVFRRAYCLFALADYDAAVEEFREFLAVHPGSDARPEAHVLLGDALCGLGKLHEGREAYAAVPPESGRFFDEAIFKQGKVLRLQERVQEVKTHFLEYLEKHPQSPRAAEAVHWIGWAWQQKGKQAEARDAYWNAVEALGSDPGQSAVEDILESLIRMYRGEGESGNTCLRRLQNIIDQQQKEGPDVLACRAHWARGRFFHGSNPVNFRTEMLAASKRLDPRTDNPRLAVDIATALEQIKLDTPATELLLEVRRWHPRTMEKARIFALLGRIAMRRGNLDEAEDYYRRFDKEAVAPPNALRGEVGMARVKIDVEKNRTQEALARLRTLQGDRKLPARIRAEAMLEAGLLQMPENPATAAPFFERVYIAFGGFSDLAARAYLERAHCLRRLGRTQAAREVLDELFARKDLARETQSLAEARKLMEELP